MATTRIIPMHVNKGKTIAQCLTERTDYAKNPDKTEDGEYISTYACDAKTADSEFLLSKRQYRQLTGREQASDVIAYQIRQSFKPGEVTPEEANRLGYEFAKRFTKGDHAYIVCTHTDKKHIHNHIIWNSTTLDCARKFRNFWGSTEAARKLSDLVCMEHRLSVIENPKPHGKSYNKWLYMPWFFTVADEVSISTWSEIGIIILMFSLGLEFNLHKLAKVGGTGVITAFTEVGGMLLLGYVTGQLLGWGVMDSIFLGGMLSMSSTTIIIKAFDELGVTKKNFAQLVFGTLVIEDIAGIFMMIILSTISVSQNISGGDLALKLGLLVLYLILWLILGIYLLPTLLNKSVTFMNDETLLVVSLGICFGMVLLANALGFSSALGAFLAGSLLAGTVHAERVEHLTSSVKDLFGAVFFLSVGMMLDPSKVVAYIGPILLITAVTLVGKLFFSSLGVLLSGQTLKNAIHCGCSLAQIGEFAFIIATLGMSLGVIADYTYPIIVSVSVITTLTTPTCIKGADKICDGVEKLLPKKLVAKLDGYAAKDGGDGESQDSDWAAYMRRYAKTTLFYGVIMLGLVIIGIHFLYPALGEYLPQRWMAQAICLLAVYLGIALFIRPMLDVKSPQYVALWMKGRQNRLPLMALNACRLIIIVLIAFAPIQSVTGMNGAWLLPVIAVAVLLIYRSGAFASAYLSVEARFLANFNERNLGKFEDSGAATEWLDEKLYVLDFDCPEQGVAGKSLIDLGWGGVYGVNVVKLVRGKKHINMPAGSTVISKHDRIYVVGEADSIHGMCLGLSLDESRKLPTLREFIESENGSDGDLYSYAISVDKDSPFAGSAIKDSRIREDYDCMILGLQRNRLPIAQPDINMTLQNGDLIWILGTKTMAGKLLSAEL